jgi:hypothetical protein
MIGLQSRLVSPGCTTGTEARNQPGLKTYFPLVPVSVGIAACHDRLGEAATKTGHQIVVTSPPMKHEPGSAQEQDAAIRHGAVRVKTACAVAAALCQPLRHPRTERPRCRHLAGHRPQLALFLVAVPRASLPMSSKPLKWVFEDMVKNWAALAFSKSCR